MPNSRYDIIEITNRINEQIELKKKEGNKQVLRQNLALLLHSNRNTIANYLDPYYLKKRMDETNELNDDSKIPYFTLPQLIKLSEVLECDLGFLLGEYEERSRMKHEIREHFGLSEKALESIEKYSKNIPWRCDWLEPSEQPTSISTEINPILESSQFYEFAKLLSAFKYSLNYYKVNPCLERKRRVKLSRYDVSTMLESILIDIERKAGFKNGEFTRTSK